jgi:protein disulfide-isomerase
MGTAQSQELNWYTDVKEAISLGNKEDKPLLLFSQEVIGVAGVSVCKRSAIYTRFAKWAAANVILVELDYQVVQSQKLKQNSDYNKLSVSRFPNLLCKRIDKEAK